MNPPRISVVIPAYNEEKYLPLCLASLKKQTFTDFEIIVVDNNSVDKTAKVAKSFGARVIPEKIQGMTPARERGFKEAKSEIIARTDADTVVSPNWLSQIYHEFQSHPKIVGLSGSFTSPYALFPKQIMQIWALGLVYLTQALTGHKALFGPNMAIKKSAWEKIKVHTDDTMVHEDIDLACHLSEVGELLFVPALTTTYSLRRIVNNPIKTARDYLPRYFRTITLHHHHKH